MPPCFSSPSRSRRHDRNAHGLESPPHRAPPCVSRSTTTSRRQRSVRFRVGYGRKRVFTRRPLVASAVAPDLVQNQTPLRAALVLARPRSRNRSAFRASSLREPRQLRRGRASLGHRQTERTSRPHSPVSRKARRCGLPVDGQMRADSVSPISLICPSAAMR
jgi:hypothetical protein